MTDVTVMSPIDQVRMTAASHADAGPATPARVTLVA